MERLRRISDFWNWLPAYRAVAETEHVRTAAERLRVSPSALSRSISLLEDSIGTQLFEREGRGIKLNPAGRAFLDSLRAAMRLIDEGLKSVESTEFSGPLHIAAPDNMTLPLWKGISYLNQIHPNLKIQIHPVIPENVNIMLCQGQLDLAFLNDVIPHDEIEISTFLETTQGIFCSDTHALARDENVTPDRIAAFNFVVQVDEQNRCNDQWPVTLPRKIGVTVDRIQGVIEGALFGDLLAVLPDQIAENYVERGLLHKINADLIPPSTFYSLRRRQLIKEDTNEKVLNIFRQTLLKPSP